PEFQLAGDSERVAITCADLGVRADDLDLPVALDKQAYRNAVALLESRGIIDERGRLSAYGKSVEAMPVDRAWAELLVHADDALVPYLAVMSAIESLHRMTRDERDLGGLLVPGSDHLTAYNVYVEAFDQCGYVGEVYGLPRHLFDESVADWAEQRGALVKSIEDAALGMASVYRHLEMPLPSRMPLAGEREHTAFAGLLARIMPFDLVIDERTADGQEARVSKTSVCGDWGAIAGELRYFADRFGIPRAAIEGTQIPYSTIRANATHGATEIVYDARRKREQLVAERRVEFSGFELQRQTTPLEDEWGPEHAGAARRALSQALASGEARHIAVKQNRNTIDELREVYRRSGGKTAKLGMAELGSFYERELADVSSLSAFRAVDLRIDPDAIVPAADRERYLALPNTVTVRDHEVEIGYEVEDGQAGVGGVGGMGSVRAVARLRLPEKLARTLVENELPVLDRPLRFTVTRGQRGAVRASTLEELQDLLDRPWSPDEVAARPERKAHVRERNGSSRRLAPRRDKRRDAPESDGGSQRGRQKGRRRRRG
ncbi:MAG: DEAD/DEAH box helicase, partial [Gemmatimonadaceae bacterium]